MKRTRQLCLILLLLIFMISSLPMGILAQEGQTGVLRHLSASGTVPKTPQPIEVQLKDGDPGTDTENPEEDPSESDTDESNTKPSVSDEGTGNGAGDGQQNGGVQEEDPSKEPDPSASSEENTEEAAENAKLPSNEVVTSEEQADQVEPKTETVSLQDSELLAILVERQIDAGQLFAALCDPEDAANYSELLMQSAQALGLSEEDLQAENLSANVLLTLLQTAGLTGEDLQTYLESYQGSLLFTRPQRAMARARRQSPAPDSLSEVWVDGVNGDDTAEGTKAQPFKTFAAAFNALVNDGTGTIKVLALAASDNSLDMSKAGTLEFTADVTMVGTNNNNGIVLSSGAHLKTSPGVTLTMKNYRSALTVQAGAELNDGTYVFRDNGASQVAGIQLNGNVIGSTNRSSITLTAKDKCEVNFYSGTTLFKNATLDITSKERTWFDAKDLSIENASLTLSGFGQGYFINKLTMTDSFLHFRSGGGFSFLNQTAVALQGGATTTSLIKHSTIQVDYGFNAGISIGTGSTLKLTDNSLLDFRNGGSAGLNVNTGTVIIENSTIKGDGKNSGLLFGAQTNGYVQLLDNSCVETPASANADNGGASENDAYIVLGGSHKIKYAPDYNSTIGSTIPTNGAQNGSEKLSYFKLANPTATELQPLNTKGTKYTYSVANASSDGQKYVWTPAAKVTFKLNNKNAKFADGETVDKTIATIRGYKLSDVSEYNGEAAGMPDDPKSLLADQTFEGWYVQAGDAPADNDQKFDPTTALSADQTVYAKWSDSNSVVVRFESNGGTEFSEESVTKGATLALSKFIPEKKMLDGSPYTFDGWYTDAELTQLAGSNGKSDFSPSGDTTLYAKWSPDTDPVTTTVLADLLATTPHITAPDTQNTKKLAVSSGDKVTIQAQIFTSYLQKLFEQNVYTPIKGSGSDYTPIYNDAVKFDLEIHLDAPAGIEFPNIQNGDITIDNTSSVLAVKNVNVTKNQDGTQSLVVTVYPSKVASSWSQYSSLSSLKSDVDKIAQNPTFNINIPNVTVTNGGTIQATISGEIAAQKGKRGSGWDIQPDGQVHSVKWTAAQSDFGRDSSANLGSTAITLTMELGNFYTLKFDTQGGSEIPDVEVQQGDEHDLTSYKPTMQDAEFYGWFKDAKATGEKLTSITPTKDMTVYAAWSHKAITGTDTLPADILIQVPGKDFDTESTEPIPVVKYGEAINYQAIVDTSSITKKISTLSNSLLQNRPWLSTDSNPNSGDLITFDKLESSFTAVITPDPKLIFPDGMTSGPQPAPARPRLAAPAKAPATSAYTLTDGDGNAVTLFSITKVEKDAAGNVTVTMTLNPELAQKSFADLKTAVTSVKNLRLQVNGVQIADAAQDGDILTVVGKVNGTFDAVARSSKSLADGNPTVFWPFTFTWDSTQMDQNNKADATQTDKTKIAGSVKLSRPRVHPKLEYDGKIYGDILIARDGSTSFSTEHEAVFPTTAGATLDYRATIDVIDIQDKMKQLENQLLSKRPWLSTPQADESNGMSGDRISFDSLSSTFTTTITPDRGLVFPGDVNAYTLTSVKADGTKSASKLFEITSVAKDSSTGVVTITMQLKDAHDNNGKPIWHYNELHDKVFEAETLVLDVARAKVADNVADGQQLTVKGSVKGEFNAIARSPFTAADGNPDETMAFAMTFRAVQDHYINGAGQVAAAAVTNAVDGTDKILENRDTELIWGTVIVSNPSVPPEPETPSEDGPQLIFIPGKPLPTTAPQPLVPPQQVVPLPRTGETTANALPLLLLAFAAAALLLIRRHLH